MTNHWIDLKNADAILAIGCNPLRTTYLLQVDRAALDNGGKLLAWTRASPDRLQGGPLRADSARHRHRFLGGLITTRWRTT